MRNDTDARSQSHLKTGEFRHHIERRDLPWQLLSDQFDASGRAVPEKTRSMLQMPNEAWIQPHQSPTREVRRDRIIGENDFAEMPMSSMQWPISLHRDYAICDNEVDRRRGADI